MSLFRSRKKSFNDGDSMRRPSFDEAPPMPIGGLGKYSFRKKKNQPELKKEINIATALPSKDDFRTSLLMPNLSARFSMLREQDDPNTKVGKASDDSVLFPKRASRMNLFNLGDLADIAEVSSISSSSIRPPFAAERGSTYSSADGYGTDDDRSVMHRSRPGQGNKFFGGRQKVYMLSTKDGEASGGKAKGRAVYDDDINLAAFKITQETSRVSDENDRDFDNSYNSKRETSSSTNSGPSDGRVSTAATSVASAAHSPAAASAGFTNKLTSFSTANDRPGKGKRLYGQGLDQHIHEQQSSALNRLNSIQRNFGPGMVYYGSAAPPMRSPSSHAVKPTAPTVNSSSQSNTSPLTGFEFGTTSETAKDHVSVKPFGAINSAPISPPMSPTDPTLIAALDANDLGKATATGAFNKPAGPYNDAQFAQRQLQLQQGRETPPIPRTFSRAESNDVDSNNAPNRERNGSQTSQQSEFSFQSSQPRAQSSLHEQSTASQPRNSDLPTNDAINSNGTYLVSRSGSEYESEPSSPSSQTMAQAAFAGRLDPSLRHRKYEHDDQHPAFNHRVEPAESRHSLESVTDLPLQSNDTSVAPSFISAAEHNEDVETQGGLSAMVRGHLRNISNQSSVYPDSPPHSSHGEVPEFPAELAIQHGFPPSPDMAVDSLAARARALRENAGQLRKAHEKFSNDRSPDLSNEDTSTQESEAQRLAELSWQEQMRTHARQGSTETQREREDFATELADRRKQVQDKLRNYVGDSRPVLYHGEDSSPPRGGPLGLLKKSSLSNVSGRGETAFKARAYQDTAPGQNPRMRFEGSRSNEQLNRSRAGSAIGSTSRDRSAGAESRSYMQKASQSRAPSSERSTPSKYSPPHQTGVGLDFSRPTPQYGSPQPGAYHPAGRARKYSPPNPSRASEGVHAPYVRSASSQGQNASASRSASNNGSYFPPPTATSQSPVVHELSPRESPVLASYSGNNMSPPELPYMHGNASRNASSQNLSPQASRKGSVNKAAISSPTFISGTSSVFTVDLPEGASLDNGMTQESSFAPPVPPINPRRRGPNFFTQLGNKSAHNVSSHSTPVSPNLTSPNERIPYMEEPEEIKSPLSDDGEPRTRFRNRLRKSSSAGDNMSARARHQALKDMERMPPSPKLSSSNKGMF